VGEKKPSAVGMDALLDFSVAVALGDDKLTAAEVRQLLASSSGLVRLRGQWVELDRERLREVLAHWERVRREAGEGGLSFLEGMRLLAGAARTEDDAAALSADEGWSRVEAGAWLARTLEGLRGPAGLAAADPGADLRGTLRPYQKVGVAWLAFASSLRLGVCLADDMGLGKTIQVLGLLLLHKRRARGGEPPHLLVAPASLLANWQAEIERFAIPPLCPRASSPSWPAPISAARISSSPPTGRSRASRRSGAGSGRCPSSTRHRRSRTPGPGRRRR
jgi:non-specific serine/threonine protein kinase